MQGVLRPSLFKDLKKLSDVDVRRCLMDVVLPADGRPLERIFLQFVSHFPFGLVWACAELVLEEKQLCFQDTTNLM